MSDDKEKRPGHCMCNACFCCYDACDFEDFVFCCAGISDCLCIRQTMCLAVGHECLGCGIVLRNNDCAGYKMTTNDERGELCKIGCLIAECGIVVPSTLCSAASQCLCCQSVCSLPFHEAYVNDCVCSVYGIQCLPQCGCCGAPPVAPAFKTLKITQSLRKSKYEAKGLTASANEEPMERA